MTKKAATREAILQQALALASQVGVSGLTIGSLAAASGLSKSGLFAHFGSKEALQLAVVQAAIDGLVDQTRSIERAIAALDLGKIELEGSDSLDAPVANSPPPTATSITTTNGTKPGPPTKPTPPSFAAPTTAPLCLSAPPMPRRCSCKKCAASTHPT